MKKKALTTFMATAITASIVFPAPVANAAVSELSANNSQYNTIHTADLVANTTVPSGETSLTITNVTASTVSTSKGSLTINTSLKPLFNVANRQALQNANATVVVKNGQITDIKALTLSKSGTKKKEMVFDGGDATISGSLTASAEYLKIKNVYVEKELIVTNRIKKELTIESVTVGDAITFKPFSYKKATWVNISLKDIKTPKINIQRNKTTLISDELIPIINVTDKVSLLEVEADVGKLVIDVDKDFDLRGKGKIEQAIVTGGTNVVLDSSHNINKVQVDDKNAKVTYAVVDKATLNALIASIQYVPVNNNGYNNGYYNGYNTYTSEKWTTQAERTAFDTAVSIAQAVANDTRATKEQVQNAITQLNTAIAIYKAAQNSYAGDKNTLTNLINSVQYVDVYWYGNNQYYNNAWTTQAEKDALVNAVSSARTVVNNYYASQYEITNAINNLNNAITTYKNAYKYGNTGYYGDKSELTSLINNIQYVEISWYNNNLYYNTAWTSQTERDDLDRAVSSARAVEINYNASQYDISNAIYNLNNAISIYKNAYKYGPNGTGYYW